MYSSLIILMSVFFHVCVFSGVRLFVTLLTIAHQASLSMGFSAKNTGVDCHSLLQGIFLTRGSTHVSCVSCIGRQILYP